MSTTSIRVTSRVAKVLAGRGQRLTQAQFTELHRQVQLHMLISRELRTIKDEFEQRNHEAALEEAMGPFGQG